MQKRTIVDLHQLAKQHNGGNVCDFYIPALNLIIEVDGRYWHNFPFGNKVDHIRNVEITFAGYNLIRLWEGFISAVI